MKRIIFILLVFLSIQGFSIWVIIKRVGGKVNDDGSITYNRVHEYDLGFLYINSCKYSGNSRCPGVGHIEVGGIMASEIQKVGEKLMREKLAQGENHGRTVYIWSLNYLERCKDCRE